MAGFPRNFKQRHFATLLERFDKVAAAPRGQEEVPADFVAFLLRNVDEEEVAVLLNAEDEAALEMELEEELQQEEEDAEADRLHEQELMKEFRQARVFARASIEPRGGRKGTKKSREIISDSEVEE